MLNERGNHKDDLNNSNHDIIYNNDFSEIKEEKSEIDVNNIFVHNLNLNCNINVFNGNIKSNTFVNNSIEYYDGSIDKSCIDFNDSLIINKINYNNVDLLMNEKHFKENQFIQNIDQKI